MKLPIVCMQCGFPQNGAPPDFTLYGAQVCDDGVYEFTCSRGHKTTTFVQEDKFEILFEIALNAIVDGYYREAVASATSSLERFYEFYSRVIAHASGIAFNTFLSTWKHVKNQSERQIGVFVACYLFHTKEAPKLMETARVSFRNDVVHKGKIPSRDEAIEYVNSVLSLISPLLLDLKKTLEGSVGAITMERMKGLHANSNAAHRSTMSISSAVSVSLAVTEPHPTTIADRLHLIESRRNRG